MLDRDRFGSNRSKVINLIDSNKIEHDFTRKVFTLFGSCSKQTCDDWPNGTVVDAGATVCGRQKFRHRDSQSLFGEDEGM